MKIATCGEALKAGAEKKSVRSGHYADTWERSARLAIQQIRRRRRIDQAYGHS